MFSLVDRINLKETSCHIWFLVLANGRFWQIRALLFALRHDGGIINKQLSQNIEIILDLGSNLTFVSCDFLLSK